jgi:AcrR family transcriptional regulator
MAAKKEKLKEFHQNRIIESAKILFADKGVNNASMDDIASHADYSKTTLYAYFKSKDEIIDRVILEHITFLKTAVETALNANPDFPGGYFAVCNELVYFYEKYPVYFELFQGEIKIPDDDNAEQGREEIHFSDFSPDARHNDSVIACIFEIGEKINATIEAYIKTHTKTREISLDISPLQAAFTLWSGLSGIITAANKKELYIKKSMGISKKEFMQNGFELLLKSIIKR